MNNFNVCEKRKRFVFYKSHWSTSYVGELSVPLCVVVLSGCGRCHGLCTLGILLILALFWGQTFCDNGVVDEVVDGVVVGLGNGLEDGMDDGLDDGNEDWLGVVLGDGVVDGSKLCVTLSIFIKGNAIALFEVVFALLSGHS